MGFVYAAASIKGVGKNINEDNYMVVSAETAYGEACMAVVCDGVGGLAQGSKASKWVTDKLRSWFKLFTKNKISCGNITDELKKVISQLNGELVQMGNDAGTKMGTTVSAILFIDGMYYVFHVGDTRIYHFSEGIRCMTIDHTLLATKIRNGQMTEEKAKDSQEKKILLQCVGADDVLEIQNSNGSYECGDVYMLCSDGQYNQLYDGEIEDVLEAVQEMEQDEMESTALELAETVRFRGEKDDMTCIFVKVSN